MTDNEIIKALEHHKISECNSCDGCPLIKFPDCVFILSKETLDLINRQKAEIEQWKGGYMTQKQEIANLEIELKAMRDKTKTAKAKAIKPVQEEAKEPWKAAMMNTFLGGARDG